TNKGVSSRDEGVPGLGFTLLENAQADAARTTIEKIQGLAMDENAQALAITQYMVGQELVAEGIATLEQVIAQGSEAPAVYRMLGDLHRGIGLNLIAAQYYESAITLAETN